MLKKLSNIKLLLLLAVLIGTIGLLKVYDRTATDWSYVSKYTHIDTSAISNIRVGGTKWVVNGNTDYWERIDYFLPSESSFAAVRDENGWTINGERTDSARTWKFLNELKQVQATTKIQGLEDQILINPEYRLTIYTPQDTTIVSCFVRNNMLLIRSSLQPGLTFDGRADSLFEQLYVGKARFFPKHD